MKLNRAFIIPRQIDNPARWLAAAVTYRALKDLTKPNHKHSALTFCQSKTGQDIMASLGFSDSTIKTLAKGGRS